MKLPAWQLVARPWGQVSMTRVFSVVLMCLVLLFLFFQREESLVACLPCRMVKARHGLVCACHLSTAWGGQCHWLVPSVESAWPSSGFFLSSNPAGLPSTSGICSLDHGLANSKHDLVKKSCIGTWPCPSHPVMSLAGVILKVKKLASERRQACRSGTPARCFQMEGSLLFMRLLTLLQPESIPGATVVHFGVSCDQPLPPHRWAQCPEIELSMD